MVISTTLKKVIDLRQKKSGIKPLFLIPHILFINDSTHQIKNKILKRLLNKIQFQAFYASAFGLWFSL